MPTIQTFHRRSPSPRALPFFLLTCVAFLLFRPSDARAADLVVTPGGSIQAAIDAASPGDRVLVAPGTYVEQLDFKGKAIAVIGVKGPHQTVVDGGGAGPVVRFANGETVTSRLQGFTVTGGAATSGAGGVAVATGAAPAVEDCIIRNNSGKFGGGVTGSPVLRRCVIRNNTASLTHGGGVYGAPTMRYCVVADNTATSADGGGMYLTGPSTVEDCLIVGNRAVFANSKGGGVYVKATTGVALTRCVIAGNSATGGVFAGVGGGVVANAGTKLVSCVVVDNHLTGSSLLGGGVYGAASLTNTVVRGNTAPQLSSVGAVTWSNVEGGYAGAGNFDLDPLFVDPSSRDYHLGAGSPNVDAGDPNLLDPDGSRSDVGAYPFATLYAVHADLDHPSWPEVSVVVGGTQAMRTSGGAALAGRTFLVAGSLSGDAPGFSLLGQHVPLNPDAWFQFTISNPNSPLLSPSLGALGAQGDAVTVFQLPGDPQSAYAGTVLHHATLVGSSTPALLLVTNALRVELVQ